MHMMITARGVDEYHPNNEFVALSRGPSPILSRGDTRMGSLVLFDLTIEERILLNMLIYLHYVHFACVVSRHQPSM